MKNTPRLFTEEVNDVIEEEKELIDNDSPKYGLALSGGGVRSAAFSLGVIQAFHKAGKFKFFDYLSTVSGGGYIGTSLIWWLYLSEKKPEKKDSQGDVFPFSDTSERGKKILNYLRAHFNYLLPTPKLNMTSLIAVIARAAFISLLVYISIISIVVLMAIYLLLELYSAFFGIFTNDQPHILVETLTPWTPNIYSQFGFVPNTLLFVGSIILVTVYLLFDIGIELIRQLIKLLGLLKRSNLKLQVIIQKLILSTVCVLPTIIVPINQIHAYLFKIKFIKDLNNVEQQLASLFMFIDIYLWSLFFVGCLIYSVFTGIYQNINSIFNISAWDNFRYRQRILAQSLLGKILLGSVVLLLLSLLILCVGLVREHYEQIEQIEQIKHVTWTMLGLFVTLLLLGSTIIVSFANFGKFTNKAVNTIVPTIGAAIFLSGIVVGVVEFMVFLVYLMADHEEFKVRFFSIDLVFSTVVVVSVVAIAVAFLVNINFLGIHRMYRDRLMELFLPSPESICEFSWRPAEAANTTMLHELTRVKHPYLLINTNVVLVDSDNHKYRRRGGDNFIFSPLYCGSAATGWIRSHEYSHGAEKGFTLATAMAISGAVANPNTGDRGFTRNRLVSIAMFMLGIRTGYWAPNPNLKYSRRILPKISRRIPPNYISPELDLALLGKLNEKSHSVDLTDGGHFENLGLYELVRRKLEYIVVVDSTCDPNYELSDLANAINLVQVDFGVSINFVETDFSLKQLRHETTKGGIFSHDFAEHGFALATINYKCGTIGKLLYIKPTLIDNISVEVLSYKARNVKFPHENTTDQFFDEQQFESYRKLGHHLVTDMLGKVSGSTFEL